jgi:NodT family efflux transporter outer membrane factor (OMF) lipoprotein
MRLLILLALLGGCAVGPDYRKPEPLEGAVAPAQFKELAGWRVAVPSDALPKGSWWSVFGDAELDALMQRVEVSNQTIRVSEARVRQARAAVDQARAALFPAVNASASATRSKSPSLSNQPSFATGAVSNYNVALSAGWELDLWGRVRRSVEAGEANWQASAADLEAAKLSARAALAQAYFGVRVADVARRVLGETVQAYGRTLQMTQNRYDAGVSARVDVVQAEVQLKAARASLMDVAVERAQLEHAIAVLIGEAPSGFSLKETFSPLAMPQIPVVMPAELLERRPDIAGAERAVAAANAQIGVAKAAYFPTVSLSGSTGYRSTSIGDLFAAPSSFWSLGAAALQGVFDGGLRRAASDQAKAAYDAEVASYRQTVLTGFQEVEDNLAALRILEEEGRLQDEVLEGARRAVDLTTNQYQAGVVSYLNVIAAQTIAFNNERAAIALLGRRLSSSVGLVRALGGGWTRDSIQ